MFALPKVIVFVVVGLNVVDEVLVLVPNNEELPKVVLVLFCAKILLPVPKIGVVVVVVFVNSWAAVVEATPNDGLNGVADLSTITEESMILGLVGVFVKIAGLIIVPVGFGVAPNKDGLFVVPKGATVATAALTKGDVLWEPNDNVVVGLLLFTDPSAGMLGVVEGDVVIEVLVEVVPKEKSGL